MNSGRGNLLDVVPYPRTPGKFREFNSLLKNSFEARLWVHRLAPETPNRRFSGSMRGCKRALDVFNRLLPSRDRYELARV
jgi:hypothetical protein